MQAKTLSAQPCEAPEKLRNHAQKDVFWEKPCNHRAFTHIPE